MVKETQTVSENADFLCMCVLLVGLIVVLWVQDTSITRLRAYNATLRAMLNENVRLSSRIVLDERVPVGEVFMQDRRGRVVHVRIIGSADTKPETEN